MLTTKEISKILNVSEETVRRWIRSQELAATQEGKSYLVDKEDLIEFIQIKAQEGGTSIGKMTNLMPLAGMLLGNPVTNLIASDVTMRLAKMIKAKDEKKKSKDNSKEVISDNVSLTEVDDLLSSLEMQKKKLNLEYQMSLLKIEEQINEYQKIKRRMEE